MASPAATSPNVELETKAVHLRESAQAIRIIDHGSYATAQHMLLHIVTVRREIVDAHAEAKRKAHEAHRAVCELERRFLEPVEAAEEFLKAAIGKYDMEQRRIREVEERKQREENERIAAEAREREIEELEQAGGSAVEVQAAIERPMLIPATVARQTEPPRVQGISTAKTYRARVTDPRALFRAAGAPGATPASGALLQALPEIEAVLSRMARSLKGVMEIPGVVVEEDVNVRAGRK
jgi:hypothetical protein